ncbi:hypothetical protein X732_11775 [Mesorhizobium sp. L2C066B000]|nr:hypothetical protein X732_11775 [Mesorhizobium sp. L2C066B000]
MKEKSAAELEREAEAARARVMETAESIRGKMTPGQLLDEFTGLFSGGESAAMLSNLRTRHPAADRDGQHGAFGTYPRPDPGTAQARRERD